jgi:O-acetylhomoserine (thiol)-lyase
MHFETLAIHAGQTVDQDTLSRGVPLYRTAAYLFKNTEHAANLFALKELGNIYTRIGNPTQNVLEERMAALEGGAAALALASGTSAIFYAIINICAAGDEVVSANNLYGGTYIQFASILPQLGITVRMVDPTDPENFRRAITSRTRAIFCETLGNPSLNMTDLEAVAAIAKEHHLPLIVDSTFTPPCLLRPIDHGANVVIHSLTKWIGGHGTSIGGIVIDAGNFDWQDDKFTLYNQPDSSYHGLRYAHDLGALNPVAFALRMRLVPLRNLGAAISPDNCWAFLQGIETLSLRVERHCANAIRLAEHLNRHPGGRLGPLPRPCRLSRQRGGQALPAPRLWRDGCLRYPGRPCRRPAVYRQPWSLLPPGQRRRCQIPGDPPGLDHPLPAQPGGTPGGGDRRGDDPAVGGHRTYRRYPGRYRPGPGQSRLSRRQGRQRGADERYGRHIDRGGGKAVPHLCPAA